MVKVVLFDDGGGELGPLTDLRSAMFVRTGALTTFARLSRLLKDEMGGELVGVLVPEALAALTRESVGVAVNEAELVRGLDDVLAVNGRLLGLVPEIELLARGQGLLLEDGTVLAARLGGDECAEVVSCGELPERVEVRQVKDAPVLRRPWDVIRYRDAAIGLDLKLLEARTGAGADGRVLVIGEAPVAVHPSARVYPGVVLNAEGGAIVIDERAVVRPGAIVTGPVYIGAGSTVLEQAHVKANTAIGPMCKVAGEIGGTIFQGFANKAHDGHLGDSWVGEWANLGAGTTNSNLLNTYGPVTAQREPGGVLERTGLTFFGTIVGDHVKTAICTRLMTGTILGTGAMIAQSIPPPRAVGRFEWLTDERKQTYRLNKFVDVMKTVMKRRGIEPSGGYVRRVGELHDSVRGAGS